MILRPINPESTAGDFGDNLPPFVDQIIGHTVREYGTFQPPWHGYLAFSDDRCIGTCAFKAPPFEDVVEIAYFTFPEHEGNGFATAMAIELIRLAREVSPQIGIVGQSLPEENASTAVMKKVGFQFEKEMEHIEDGLIWQWRLPSPPLHASSRPLSVNLLNSQPDSPEILPAPHLTLDDFLGNQLIHHETEYCHALTGSLAPVTMTQPGFTQQIVEPILQLVTASEVGFIPLGGFFNLDV
jgi:[ribosomal protein S5]-alanine N-acetyltransferase